MADTSKKNIPFFAPWITNEDKKAVMDALSYSLLTDGPKLRQFESAFAKFTGAKYAIGVSNATSALQDRKSTRLNSSHIQKSRMPSSA